MENADTRSRPSLHTEGPHRMDQRYVWYYFLTRVWGTLLAVIILASFAMGPAGGVMINMIASPISAPHIFIIVILLVIGGTLGWAQLVYHFYQYELREHEFRKEYGVLNKKYVSVPYSRIQNVDINRNLLHRIIGISEIMIQTAGEGYRTEGRLPGLSKQGAEDLREKLLENARRENGEGL